MGCCCSSEEYKKNKLIEKVFINDSLGPYNRSLLEELGTCSFCKQEGISVIYKWLGTEHVYICEFCETKINEHGIKEILEEVL